MTNKKQIEAEIKTAAGTTIILKGTTAEVSKVVGLFASGSQSVAQAAASPAGTAAPVGSWEGVAEKDAEGNVHIVVTDLKAKNAIDAAKRLIYITLFARKRLLQEQKTDRAIVISTLTAYGLYDGNTRNIIPRDKALIKEGRKKVSLSAAAVPQAEKYVQEMKDVAVHGKWSPGKTRKRRKTKKSTK